MQSLRLMTKAELKAGLQNRADNVQYSYRDYEEELLRREQADQARRTQIVAWLALAISLAGFILSALKK